MRHVPPDAGQNPRRRDQQRHGQARTQQQGADGRAGEDRDECGDTVGLGGVRPISVAERTPADCIEQYAFTKRACRSAALRDIAALADPLDEELAAGMTSDPARHAHPRYWQQLKGRPADW